jgi:transcription-repair coupling factor (superfamily II helicase)
MIRPAPASPAPLLGARDLPERFLAQVSAGETLRALADAGAGHLGGIAASGQAFIASCFARVAPEKRLWVICQDLRHQERVVAELETWGHRPHFLPEEEHLPVEVEAADPEILAERLHVLAAIAASTEREPVVLVTRSLEEDAPAPGSFRREVRVVSEGETLEMEELAALLRKAGYEVHPQVFARGQYAIRGGILDVFPWQAGQPTRLEFFGDLVESLRDFDLHSQTSIRRVPKCEILLDRESARGTTVKLRSWIGEHDLALALGEAIEGVPLWVDDDPEGGIAPALAIHGNPVGSFEAGDLLVSEAKHASFARDVARWKADGWHVALLFQNEGEKERFHGLFEGEPDLLDALDGRVAPLAFGFTCPSAKLAVLSAAEIFGRFPIHRARRKFNREAEQRRIRHAVDARDLEEGEPVVHADYGIAIYRGMAFEETQGGRREVLVLEYADEARLFVPLDQSHLVSRYVGAGNVLPSLSKLGDARWGKTRRKAEKEIMDYAARLLRVQAERQTIEGHAHPPDTRWQWEFEHSFPHRETTDQLKAIRQVKEDMEAARPMDRLICGDVGFGKTEVAIRAAFKAVMGGTQVAVLVPTTVLAQQHYDTFRERMSGFPVRVELLCRLQSPAEQDAIVAGLADGSVDMVIGTHRVVSSDVRFARLGLVVIDEEQRFGVKHKERFKEMFRLVDVLTLSATPIPRTLYMSLVGLREMSTIETPPPNRLPVHTIVCAYDERVIRAALQEELRRGGQVFYLHNRVRTIEKVREKISSLVPGARVVVGHGQMDRHDLEEVMHTFVRGQADVLVATTIIESGIDIPNANTIFIDRADLFGLADLYQLRGRVGRSGTKAYAYLMLPRHLVAAGDARKRLNAMKEYAALGSGFKVAMRDLEIRGAGSLLGLQQSGHIANIGFDLYCQLLRQSVAQLGGHATGGRVETVLHTDFLAFSESEHAGRPKSTPAYLPASWITEPSQRVLAYKQLAECVTRKELKALVTNWRDRFGPLPPAARVLADATALRIEGARARAQSIEIRDRKLMVRRGGDFILVDGKFPRLNGKDGPACLAEALDLVEKL